MLVHIFLYVHHNTVQCEGTAATERLATFPNFFYILQKKHVCVCPSVYV